MWIMRMGISSMMSVRMASLWDFPGDFESNQYSFKLLGSKISECHFNWDILIKNIYELR